VVEASRPPGPFAFPAELPAPVTDPLTSGVRYAGVEYARVWGYRPLRLDLVLPPYASGQVPVVVWVHGGMWLFGSRLEGPGTGSACRALVERGVAVAQVEHRFSGEVLFPGCLHDVKAAVRWLRRFGPDLGADGEAIGIWGESSGGHLAALVAMNGHRPAARGRCRRHRCPVDCRPVTHVTADAAPPLLVHGLDDALVPPRQSVLLHEALQSVGADSELEQVAGAGHVLFGVDVGPIADRSADFLVRRLG
jgi:acetyl esterase/lipase